MKSVNKIFVVLFLLCVLWPFGEFFVNQWRNPDPFTLSGPSTFCELSGSNIYVRLGTPTTFTDYIIINCADLSGGGSPIAIGLTRLFSQLACTVLLRVSNLNAINNVSLTNIVAVSSFLARTVYIFLVFLAVYIIFMPFLLVAKFWRSKT